MMIWLSPKIKPSLIPDLCYSEDILLLVDGVVFTGYWHETPMEIYKGWFVYLPRVIDGLPPIQVEPDGWMPRNELPSAPVRMRQLNFYGEKDGKS